MSLKLEYITPFIQGVKETFETMLGRKVYRRDIYIKKGYTMFGEVSGVIGMSGIKAGTCAVSLPQALAAEVIADLMGIPEGEVLEQQVINDGVGEMINMIAGHAKRLLSATEYNFDITLPTIISGAKHEVFQRTGTESVVILFEAQGGSRFTLEVCVSLK